jgi:hypothetical protein
MAWSLLYASRVGKAFSTLPGVRVGARGSGGGLAAEQRRTVLTARGGFENAIKLVTRKPVRGIVVIEPSRRTA